MRAPTFTDVFYGPSFGAHELSGRFMVHRCAFYREVLEAAREMHRGCCHRDGVNQPQSVNLLVGLRIYGQFSCRVYLLANDARIVWPWSHQSKVTSFVDGA